MPPSRSKDSSQNSSNSFFQFIHYILPSFGADYFVAFNLVRRFLQPFFAAFDLDSLVSNLFVASAPRRANSTISILLSPLVSLTNLITPCVLPNGFSRSISSFSNSNASFLVGNNLTIVTLKLGLSFTKSCHFLPRDGSAKSKPRPPFPLPT